MTYQRAAGSTTRPARFAGDSLFFLHTVPFMAALALTPHARKMRETLRYGLLDLLLLTLFWFYVYIFTAMPWKFAAPDPACFTRATSILHGGKSRRGIRLRSICSSGHARLAKMYGHSVGAFTLYVVGIFLADTRCRALIRIRELARLPVMAAFVWMATAGIIAKRHGAAAGAARSQSAPRHAVAGAMAMLGVLAAPILAIWDVFFSSAPDAVKQFRMIATLCGDFVGATELIFYRQHLVYIERTGLVHDLWGSLENIKRLQTHFVQSEKLASLGQLAAGAAHEINNPLTAILGYSEVLDDRKRGRNRGRTRSA